MSELRRYLLASSAGAALLGLAASGLVRVRLAAGPIAVPRPEAATGIADAGTQPSPPSQVATSSAPATVRAPAVTGLGPRASAQVDARTRAPRHHASRPGHAKSSLAPTGDAVLQQLVRGIAKVGDLRYELKRDALDLALHNLVSLSRWVHVMPDVRSGRPFGFRLFAISSDGPFAKLGFRDDDILVSVNGLAVATPDQALEAYAKLRTANHLVLSLVRGESQVVQEYIIR